LPFLVQSPCNADPPELDQILQSHLVRLRISVTLRLAIYRQSVRLSAKHLETRGQISFQLNNFFQSLCNILSDERMDLSFTISASPRQGIHSQVRGPQDSSQHCTISDSRLAQPEGQVPVLISPRNRVGQLYPQALGSLSVAIYDSQGVDHIENFFYYCRDEYVYYATVSTSIVIGMDSLFLSSNNRGSFTGRCIPMRLNINKYIFY
jgi:hypothetical protein